MKISYKDAVRQAIFLYDAMKKIRLKIAELALAVCDGGHGNQRTVRSGPSFTQFASDIGVDRTTLISWIGALSKFKEENPESEPEVKDFKPYIKKFQDRPDAERATVYQTKAPHRATRKLKSLLTEVNSVKNFLQNEKPELSEVDSKILNELRIKLNEVKILLDGAKGSADKKVSAKQRRA